MNKAVPAPGFPFDFKRGKFCNMRGKPENIELGMLQKSVSKIPLES